MDVFDRITLLMNDKDIKAAQLMRETGLNLGLVTHWKKGLSKPSTDAIVKIAKYFNVSTDWLLTGEDFKGDIMEDSVLKKSKKPIIRMIARDAKENLSARNADDMTRYLAFLYPEDLKDDYEERKNEDL